MRQYLVLENDQQFVNNSYRATERDFATSATPFELVYVTTVEEAQQKLATGRFKGAILDLRLSNDAAAEGNEVAIQIHRDYFMPIAVVSGFVDEVDERIRELADSGSAFVRLFNKNERIRLVFEFLLGVEDSGILDIVGPGGEMNQMLSDIFWKHLGPVLQQWRAQPLNAVDRKRILRHAVAHMLCALQTHEPGTWDRYQPAEVYIWPPICPNEMTGDIYVKRAEHGETNDFFLLVTPACDLANRTQPGAVRHFLRILPFSSFTNENKMVNLVAKKEHRYHVLPPTNAFRGGVVDFASISVLTANTVESDYLRKGSVVESYWRELVNRLGSWLARQGTPEFDRAPLMEAIRAQWPAPAATVNRT